MKEEIWNHIIKRLTNQETGSSEKELNNWLAEDAENRIRYEEVAVLWQMTSELKPEEARHFPHSENLRPVKKRFNIWGYGIAAACTAVLVTFGIHFFSQKKTSEPIEWVNLAAPQGKVIRFTLPDSSAVILNAGSNLQYAKQFNTQKTRHIKLTGEAFFDVTHREKQPFVVESGKVKTVVYGTSFNIRAYQNEAQIKVSVKTGKVGVLKNDGNPNATPIFLIRNKALTFDTLSQHFAPVSATKADISEWAMGTLTFDQTPVKEVLASLSRSFDVKFDVSALNHSGCKLTARFEHKDLQTILKTIHTVMNIQINQTDHTIYLKGGNTCN